MDHRYAERNHPLLPTALAILAIVLAGTGTAAAQTYTVDGTVTSEEVQGTSPLEGATVVILSLPDTAMVRGTTSNRDGSFEIPGIAPGEYLLAVTFVGYRAGTQRLEITDASVRGLEFHLQYGALELDDVLITGRRPRIEVRGDTTAFNADAFATRPDATAEELISRMPGFTVEGGRVQAQGEDVRRVLVDGDEFFGDDATAALRNLPAEIIQQIEVFDRQSDQARFTGFDDGNAERTINVVTRSGMNNGTFGRLNSGYGADNRYVGSGNLNMFDGPRRISIVGMSNNVNQQNFAMEDLIGVAQAGSDGGQGRGGGGGRGMRGGPPGGGQWGGGGSVRDFMVGQQDGISTVHSLGVNYTDRWGDDWRVNGSYFFNMTDNLNDQSLERRYLTGFAADNLYHEETLSSSDNFNHRVNMRMEYTLDENRSLIITPRASVQQNSAHLAREAYTLDGTSALLNSIVSENRSDQTAYSLSNTILYRHRLTESGRTFSVNLRSNYDDRTGDRFQYDETMIDDQVPGGILTNQEMETFTGGYTVSADLSYTEPITARSQLMLSYQPSFNRNSSVQDALLFDPVTQEYALLDTALSNRYQNHLTTQRAQAGYRLRGDRYNANFTLAWQYTGLDGRQTFPMTFDTRQSWQNLLPGATYQYRFESGTNVRLQYNARTRTPSARQLQDVIDNSNPLRLSTGNPALEQQYEHILSLRFRAANTERAISTMAFLSAGFTQNYIGNHTITARQDSLLHGGILLGRGSQLVSPDNIGEAFNVRTFLVQSMPVDLISSNVNFNAGITFSRTPSLSDHIRSFSNTVGLNAGTMVTSSISPRLDFRAGYQGSYNLVRNTVRPELDANYFTGRASAGLNVLMESGLVLGSDFNLRHYEGLGADYNRSSLFWNASIGYRFMQNDAMEIRFTALDIFSQNDNVNRMISDDFVEDYRSNVLGRYGMVTLSYNFRSFAGGR